MTKKVYTFVRDCGPEEWRALPRDIAKGETVHRFTGYMYGLERDDFMYIGVPTIGCTLNPEDAGGFTVPVELLRDEEGNRPSSEYVNLNHPKQCPVKLYTDVMSARLGGGMPGSVQEARMMGALFVVIAIPWEMLEPHSFRVWVNHETSLLNVIKDGGLTSAEMAAVLEDRLPVPAMGVGESNNRLAELLLAHLAQRATSGYVGS